MEFAFILFLFVFNVTFRERLEHFRIVSMVTTGDPRLKKPTPGPPPNARSGHGRAWGYPGAVGGSKHPAPTIVMLHNVSRISWLVGDCHIIHEFPFFTRIFFELDMFFRQKACDSLGTCFWTNTFLGLKRPHFLDTVTSWNLWIPQRYSTIPSWIISSWKQSVFSGLFATTASGFSEQTGRKALNYNEYQAADPTFFLWFILFRTKMAKRLGLFPFFWTNPTIRYCW